MDNFKQSSEVEQALHKGLEYLYQESHLASRMFQKHPELQVKKKKFNMDFPALQEVGFDTKIWSHLCPHEEANSKAPTIISSLASAEDYGSILSISTHKCFQA